MRTSGFDLPGQVLAFMHERMNFWDRSFKIKGRGVVPFSAADEVPDLIKLLSSAQTNSYIRIRSSHLVKIVHVVTRPIKSGFRQNPLQLWRAVLDGKHKIMGDGGLLCCWTRPRHFGRHAHSITESTVGITMLRKLV